MQEITLVSEALYTLLVVLQQNNYICIVCYIKIQASNKFLTVSNYFEVVSHWVATVGAS